MREKILSVTPDIQSQASLRLLQDNLGQECYSRTKVWLEFRARLLGDILGTEGVLRCHYCGKAGLQIETVIGNDPFLATLDHVTPRSRGGAEFDLGNLVVACFPCNSNKADKILTGTATVD